MKRKRDLVEAALMALGAGLGALVIGYCMAALAGVVPGDVQACAQFHGISEVWCWAER